MGGGGGGSGGKEVGTFRFVTLRLCNLLLLLLPFRRDVYNNTIFSQVIMNSETHTLPRRPVIFSAEIHWKPLHN